jgi:hypothetical protein
MVVIVAIPGRDRDHLQIRLPNCLQCPPRKGKCTSACHPVILICDHLLRETKVGVIGTISLMLQNFYIIYRDANTFPLLWERQIVDVHVISTIVTI